MNKNLGTVRKALKVLQDPSSTEEEKVVAEEKIQRIKNQVETEELVQQGVPRDRAYDVLLLLKTINNPFVIPEDRARAKISLQTILNESKEVKSMRSSLIREMQRNNWRNVRDISEEARKNSKYINK